MVETVINPLTSALYPDDRVGRLGILHAWYPAGVVAGALIRPTASGTEYHCGAERPKRPAKSIAAVSKRSCCPVAR